MKNELFLRLKYHMAGHIVVAKLLPLIELVEPTGDCNFFITDIKEYSSKAMSQLVMTYLAGIVTEEILFHERSRDLAKGWCYDMCMVHKLKSDYSEEKKQVESIILANMILIHKIGRLLINGDLNLSEINELFKNI